MIWDRNRLSVLAAFPADLRDSRIRHFKSGRMRIHVFHLRRKIRLYTEAPISLSLLFGLFENELLDVAVNLILLCAIWDR